MRLEGKADLHCHTKASDNTLTVREVLAAAHDAGIRHLAITDHDTTQAVEEAVRLGTPMGMNIIPGIEISGFDYARNRRAHILGYYVSPGHEALERICRPMLEQRHQASMQSIMRLQAAGFRITLEQVMAFAEGGTAIYKQHIMHALKESGYCDSISGELQKRLFSRKGEGNRPGMAYIPLRYIDAFDAIAAIKQAGGIPVLAHPGQLDNFDAIPDWVAAGLQGIEVWHPSHNREHEERARGNAERFRLAMTGGSDFHGGNGYDGFPIGSVSVGIDRLLALEARR